MATKVNNLNDSVDSVEEDLPLDFTVFDFRVDHIKYTIKIQDHIFELDVLFITSKDKIQTNATCYQDSLYVDDKFNMELNDNTLDNIESFIKQNIKTFIKTKSTDDIIIDIDNNLIEIYDLDHRKRILKLARFLLTDKWKLKVTPDFDIKKVENLIIQHKNSENCPSSKILLGYKTFEKKVTEDTEDIIKMKKLLDHLSKLFAPSNAAECSESLIAQNIIQYNEPISRRNQYRKNKKTKSTSVFVYKNKFSCFTK